LDAVVSIIDGCEAFACPASPRMVGTLAIREKYCGRNERSGDEALESPGCSFDLAFRRSAGRRSLTSVAGIVVGAWRTRDSRWRVDVGGVGSVVWYWLVGPNTRRALPSTPALVAALAEVGVDPADLVEVAAAA
jgi:hypothetical protein